MMEAMGEEGLIGVFLECKLIFDIKSGTDLCFFRQGQETNNA